ncbi:hypothetical protein BDF22DRAFT_740456 [Syncephalis plumigaleata]|nr:hypothetical protein BDF22DRAFT_740456 [Syncephalis plumigaleata]
MSNQTNGSLLANDSACGSRYLHAPLQQHHGLNQANINALWRKRQRDYSVQRAREARQARINGHRQQQYTSEFLANADLEESYLEWELKQERALRQSMGINDELINDGELLDKVLSMEHDIQQELQSSASASASSNIDGSQLDDMTMEDPSIQDDHQYWQNGMNNDDNGNYSSNITPAVSTNDHWSTCPGQQLIFSDDSIGNLALCSHCDYCGAPSTTTS